MIFVLTFILLYQIRIIKVLQYQAICVTKLRNTVELSSTEKYPFIDSFKFLTVIFVYILNCFVINGIRHVVAW